MSLSQTPKILRFKTDSYQSQLIDLSEFNALYIEWHPIDGEDAAYPEIRATKWGSNYSHNPDNNTSISVFEWSDGTPLSGSSMTPSEFNEDQIEELKTICSELMLNDLVEFILTPNVTLRVIQNSDIDNYIYIASRRVIANSDENIIKDQV